MFHEACGVLCIKKKKSTRIANYSKEAIKRADKAAAEEETS